VSSQQTHLATLADPTGFLPDFATMSAFGATQGGGVERQAGSAADHATRAWFTNWLVERGFTVREDAIGNIFGLYELVPGAPYVLMGSHLDSQPLAGRFDGAYGVLAAAHAAHAVVKASEEGRVRPALNVAVVDWFNEEGSRFAPSMMGSSVATGKLALAEALAVTDTAGITVAEALGERPVPVPGLEVASYAEIHIEQGRLLEEAQTTIGLVHATWAASKYRISVNGAQAHTGATVMEDRRDALYGASLLVVAVRELTEELPAGALHSSVSEMEVLPNSPVTLARQVNMNLDLRSASEEVLARANELLAEKFEAIEAKAKVSIERRLTHAWGLVDYPSAGVELARESAAALGLSHTPIMTVAGHDSTNMKDVVPTVMLFVPSIQGVSHNEAEDTTDADAVDGVAMLGDVAARLVAGELHEGGSYRLA
jgi:N-carbamoyl-L-amino-acid hydrolase